MRATSGALASPDLFEERSEPDKFTFGIQPLLASHRGQEEVAASWPTFEQRQYFGQFLLKSHCRRDFVG